MLYAPPLPIDEGIGAPTAGCCGMAIVLGIGAPNPGCPIAWPLFIPGCGIGAPKPIWGIALVAGTAGSPALGICPVGARGFAYAAGFGAGAAPRPSGFITVCANAGFARRLPF